ncbi:D-ribose pyranase [Vibrio zhugei]|uniref:D-ribose pyranase n=1 Tax=Vibrio zhugei TaxID=2479546 RepID=A0ABV7C8C7_9VIBR|nr:D-ribose pyranase [Vibrio zhugei]
MKKSALLNAPLSQLVASLGHTDEYTVCDAGLPIPSQVQRIDLALTAGIPSFLDTVATLLSESQVESVILAEEIREMNADLHQSLLTLLEQESQTHTQPITVEYMPHEAFKARTQRSKAIVRTGECSPFANIIFRAGVTF